MFRQAAVCLPKVGCSDNNVCAAEAWFKGPDHAVMGEAFQAEEASGQSPEVRLAGNKCS